MTAWDNDEDDTFLSAFDLDIHVAQALERRRQQTGAQLATQLHPPEQYHAPAPAPHAANPPHSYPGGSSGHVPVNAGVDQNWAPPHHPAAHGLTSSRPHQPNRNSSNNNAPSTAALRSLFFNQPALSVMAPAGQAPETQQNPCDQRPAPGAMQPQPAIPQPVPSMPRAVAAQEKKATNAQQVPPSALPAVKPPPGPPPAVYASLTLPRSVGTSGKAHGGNTMDTEGPPNDSSKDIITEPLLEVRMNWHEGVAAALKRIPGGSWDIRRRAFVFPISAHDRIIETLQSVQGVRMSVEPLSGVPSTVLQAASSLVDDSSRYRHIPASLESQLMPFQREGVKFGLRRAGRCLIGDEMGLGKTVQAIALAAAYRDDWPGLIVAPSSLREQWADALHRWLGITEDRVHIVHSGRDAAAVPTHLDFLVVSYSFLDKMELAGKYQFAIVDESHYIKDSNAKRTKAALPILKEAKRCVLLTGTPALNRPKEIFTQLSALLPSAKLKLRDFGDRYCGGNRFDRFGGAQNLDELHSMLRGSIMVRRLKADVLSQLPKKRRQQVYLTLEVDARRELSAMQNQMDAVKAILGQLAAQNAASGGAVSVVGGRMEENKAIMEMYRRTAELKTKAVQEYVDMLLDGGQKFLIFAHHTVLLDAVEHTCNRRRGCRFIRIDGKTPPADRSRLVNSFQDDEGVRVAILSIRAAGVGLTLTAASTVVFAELTWTPGEIIQAEDRAHRIGQASSVNVYFLHVKSSVDDIIWNSVQNKLEHVGQALDGEDRAMEMSGIRTMPERGQKSLETYYVPRNGQALQQRQEGAAFPMSNQCNPADSHGMFAGQGLPPQAAGVEQENYDGVGVKRPREWG